MKLHVMSDLHLDLLNANQEQDFFKRLCDQDREGVKAVVLAGDIGSLKKTSRVLFGALESFCELYDQVLFIPGNHEYWGASLVEGRRRLDAIEKALPDLTVLRAGKQVVLPQSHESSHPDLTVGGDTLWFPEPYDAGLKEGWPDYEHISDSQDISREHQKFLKDTALPDVVVTHHFPTKESIASEYRDSEYNCFFCADLELWLAGVRARSAVRFRTRLWISGHTHYHFDYVSKFGFRSYCNPLGYRNEGSNPGFWDQLVVDTDVPLK